MPSDRRLNVGIIGLGTGAMNMLPELSANPNARIVAAADPRLQALERFKNDFNAEVFSDAAGLCTNPNVDVVYIMSPDELHADHAVLAANNGKHVLADKPMGITLEDCDRVIEATERNGVRIIIGHSQSLDPPNLKLAEIANSGRLGRQVMIHTLFYSDWIYRPRAKEELMQEKGGSIVRRQGPIQVDIVRMIGGGRVKSVRAAVNTVDPQRPIDGSYTVFLEFEEGHTATMVYGGYGHFNSAELTYGYTLQGMPYDPELHVKTHRRAKGFVGAETEEDFKESSRYGGSMNRPVTVPLEPQRRHAFFGLTLVSCERGDIRQTPTGVVIYKDDGTEHIDVAGGQGYTRRYGSVEVDEMHRAVSTGKSVRIHDARWGKATLEVVLGIIESSRTHSEVQMHHQVPYAGQDVM